MTTLPATTAPTEAANTTPLTNFSRLAIIIWVGPTRSGDGLTVRAGELSPRALRQKWREKLASFSAHPAARPQLGLHELEMVIVKERLETIRVAQDLAPRADEALAALRTAAERTDASW